MSRAWLVCAVALVACDNEPRKWPVPDGGQSSDAGEKLRIPNLDGVHVASCTDDTACGNTTTNPPLGGNHCPVWLNCRTFDTAQPRCNWIHNLEHGHAVLLYNCPNGCPETVQKLSALRGTRTRTLLTPDPKLPRKVAAVVWGFGWMGDEYDEAQILDVLANQDREAPEAGAGCSP